MQKADMWCMSCVCFFHVTGSYYYIFQTDWRTYMANRARDEVIYIRVDEALKNRFDRIKEASGYKGNADFLNYLLDVYDGKRVDGVTLKDIRELLAQAVHEMKKQGVNINQIAYNINVYPGVFSDFQFQVTNVFLKKIEDLLLKITEKLI